MPIERVERDIEGRRFSIEIGKIARQADGSAVVNYADTMVLAAVCQGPERLAEGIIDEDFLPLTVDYREKTSAAGKFPGGFYKREGRPRDKETLTCRLIDRPIRPLFPSGYINDLQVQIIVFSADRENDPDVLSVNAASAALAVSGLPFREVVGCVRVGRVNGRFILNPTHTDLAQSDLELVVAGTANAVQMVEGPAHEVSEDVLVDAIEHAHAEVREICAMIEELKRRCPKAPKAFTTRTVDAAHVKEVKAKVIDTFRSRLLTPGKLNRQAAIRELKEQVVKEYKDKEAKALAEGRPYTGPNKQSINAIFPKIEHEVMREMIIREGRRVDGRRLDEIRPITCEVGVLARCHGSALFTRGETQALVTTTLGTAMDDQLVDGLEEEYSKKFMLHYNFPSFSVGETKPNRGPGRREIGHGYLAEKAIMAVVPEEQDFPYTIRVVSDILESNGSSSMASVCGGTLALLDAGVRLKSPVAGIAMGLVMEEGKVAVLSDILGGEDKHGDMDFKIAGTANGITAVQMDIKAESGLSPAIMRKALEQARTGRLHVLSEMARVLAVPREQVSVHAPKIVRIMINPTKIGALIGPGGKVVRKIEEETHCTLEIEDSGEVMVSGIDFVDVERAVANIKALTEDVEVGRIYQGKVVSIRDFGAFIELGAGGQEGLCHISELAGGYVEKVEDVVQVGMETPVKVISVDDMGRVRVSRRQALDPNAPNLPGPPERSGGPPRSGGFGGGRGGGGRGGGGRGGFGGGRR